MFMTSCPLPCHGLRHCNLALVKLVVLYADKLLWIFIPLMVFSTVYFFTAARLATKNFHNGLFSIQADNNSSCHLPLLTPWPELLPNRAGNFFTGFNSCPSVPQFSTIQNGVLRFNELCFPHQKRKVVVNPGV